MAGSLSLSLSQQFDSQGRPLSGGKLYFFATGTSTPQDPFQDTALTIKHPNPITLDSSGRIPVFYLADGTIKIRLADVGGVTILSYDGLLVIGPSSGGGSPPSVDATKLFDTGDIKKKYSNGTLAGWVRCNKRTIGSATSGATERANADTQALFEYLWNIDPNLIVSGGRGANSTADFTANKTIETPDGRGRGFAGLDDMGNTAAGRLTSSYFGASGIVLGNSGGAEFQTLTQPQLPNVSPTFTGNQINLGTLASNESAYLFSGSSTPAAGGSVGSNGPVHTIIPPFTPSGNISALGSGNPHNNTQPTILVTFYIKL